MASSSKMSLRVFTLGSQQLNQEKAEINAALTTLFIWCAEEIKTIGPRHWELNGCRLELRFYSSPFDSGDIVFVSDLPDREVTISQSSTRGMAQRLRDEEVGTCHALVEQFMYAMIGFFPDKLSSRLGAYSAAAARGKVVNAE